MRILLVSLYYEPLRNIASTRIKYFSKFLSENGNDVDVITRFYDQETIKNSDLLVGSVPSTELQAHYEKKSNVVRVKFNGENGKKRVSDLLPPGIKGVYNLSQTDVFHYSFVENAMIAFEREFADKSYDFIIASSPVPAALLLAKKISLKYRIPWIADFRDSIFKGSGGFLFKKFQQYTVNKLLSSASGLLYVSPGLQEHCDNLLSVQNRKIPSKIVMNGFIEPKLSISSETLDKLREIKETKKLIVYTGSLYSDLNLEFFIAGLNKLNDPAVCLVLVGIQDEFKVQIEKALNFRCVFIPKVSHELAISIQREADVLIIPMSRGYYTGFSGKIFEYLSAQKPVILDYLPPKDLAQFLKGFHNVYGCEGELQNFVDFIGTKMPNEHNDPDEMLKISRKYQVDQLNQFLLSLK